MDEHVPQVAFAVGDDRFLHHELTGIDLGTLRVHAHPDHPIAGRASEKRDMPLDGSKIRSRR